jgi:outer membrane protein TolC
VAEREDGHWALGPLVELEIPLLDQGQAERAASLAEQHGQELQRRQAAIDVRASARTLLSRLQASRSRARHYGERVVPARERILRQTLLSYNAMTAGVFQLLAAQGAVERTRIAQVTTLRDYWLSRADLEQLLAGRLVRGQSNSAGAPASFDPASGQSFDAH